MKKGQISVELIIIMFFLMLILLFSVSVFNERNSGLTISKQQAEAKLIAKNMAGHINSVFFAGDGTEITIALEKSIDYNVSVSGNSLRVFWSDGFNDATLATENVTIISAVPGNDVLIKNESGVVVVESI